MNNHDPQNYVASPAISTGIEENNVLILDTIAQPGSILIQSSCERVFVTVVAILVHYSVQFAIYYMLCTLN